MARGGGGGGKRRRGSVQRKRRSEGAKGAVATDIEEDENGVFRLRVECREGDLFLINTRLWWHQTFLPPAAAAAATTAAASSSATTNSTSSRGNNFSFSYARDFYCDATSALLSAASSSSSERSAELTKGNKTSGISEGKEEEEEEEFNNVDGIYASRNVAAGCVVLLESELPECSLPRSLEGANCAVEWDEHSGEGCLVALRDISAGDWLCVAPSDDEGEECWEEEEEHDTDEEEEDADA